MTIPCSCKQEPSQTTATPPALLSSQEHKAIETGIPREVIKLSNMRKTIARRLTESKQTVPHIYLTVDVRLDALLKLREELNASLEARGIKLSVNDMLIKALALVRCPNVMSALPTTICCNSLMKSILYLIWIKS